MRQAVQAIGKPAPKAGVRVKARVVVTRSAPFYFVTMAIEQPHNYAGQVRDLPLSFVGISFEVDNILLQALLTFKTG